MMLHLYVLNQHVKTTECAKMGFKQCKLPFQSILLGFICICNKYLYIYIYGGHVL